MKYLLKISLKHTNTYVTKKKQGRSAARALLLNLKVLNQHYKDSDQVFDALTDEH
jgi:hypothetical protein